MVLHRICAFAAVLMLAASGCTGNDPAEPVPPAPPTTDDLIIADCYEIQAALEAYAAGNGGEYPAHWRDVEAFEESVKRLNRYTGFETEPRLMQVYWPGQIGVMLYYEIDGSYDVHGYRIEGRGAHGILITLENIAGVSQESLDAYATLLEEVLVIENAVQLFTAEAGRLPETVGGDTTPLGNTLVDFLPGGRLLVDPLTGYTVNPVEGTGWGTPGFIGYIVENHVLTEPPELSGFVSYTIDVGGPYAGDLIAIRRPHSDEDNFTRAWISHVRATVEGFLMASGRYPSNVDLDETPSGDTVLDLLPAMYNVYTGTVMTPRNGLATAPGEIGYQPVIENDVVVGYVINGFGIVEEFYRIEVLP